jgi:hypothetical protein
MLFITGNRYGLEFKYTDAPQRDKVTKRGQEDLKLKHVFIVHPGSQSYPLNQWAESLSIVKMKKRFTSEGEALWSSLLESFAQGIVWPRISPVPFPEV